MHAVVVGAGAFGGWTALFLRRQGLRVTLVDAWGPGNSRASSGGETRIIRSIYGDDLMSTRFTLRSLALWKEHEQRWQTQMFLPSGILFLAGKEDEFLSTSKTVLAAEGVTLEELTLTEAARRFPQISFDGIESVIFERDAGVLLARENCRTVAAQFVAEGGEFVQAAARPRFSEHEPFAVELNPGGTLQADLYVFACGPWLGQLFPEVAGSLIEPTRQEVFFFGTPPGDARFQPDVFPCWADRTSEGKFYGIPDVQNRGFKLASDLRGPKVDPTSESRAIDSSAWNAAREYVGRRFPSLADAPLVESRVCVYENSPDFGLVIDRHPKTSNIWLVGGGSGHGYKQGPAVGEHVAGVVTESIAPFAEFSLGRFANGVIRRKTSTL